MKHGRFFTETGQGDTPAAVFISAGHHTGEEREHSRVKSKGCGNLSRISIPQMWDF